MKVALIGTGPHVEARAAAVRSCSRMALAEHLPEATAAGVLQRQEAALDVAFLCGTAGRRVEGAEAALRQGRHLFLEWPPAASVREAERLAERAEEAGVEVGVSRPLRFHPLFDRRPAAARVDALSVQQERGSAQQDAAAGGDAFLADSLDLCCALVESGSVTRLDAQAVRSSAPARFETVLASLRFSNGAYAHVALRQGPRRERRLHAAGPHFHLCADLDMPDVTLARSDGERDGAGRQAEATAPPAASRAFRAWLLRREARAYLRALRSDRPAPVSLFDVLPTMRLTERLMRRMR